MNLSNKRILITQPILHNFCGSTVVTIELAEYFKKCGAKVGIYAYTYDEPVVSELKKRKIKVYLAQDSTKLDLCRYDYVWIHSQVFPESMVKQLSTIHEASERPFFIFLHMSTHDYIPDEFQWIYSFEDKIADKVLFISEEVRDSHLQLMERKKDTDFFRNPAPIEFSMTRATKNVLRKILIVSNHVPKELNDAVDILSKKGINVDHLGANGKRYGLIAPTDINNYDAVITIGKTVQYCILGKRPVYIYDSFGGPGYLTRKNFNKAMAHNFSGRGFRKKKATKIANEIVDGWGSAKKDINHISEHYSKDFCINTVIDDIMKTIKKGNIPRINNAQMLSIYYSQRLARYRFVDAYNLERKNAEYVATLEKLRLVNNRLQDYDKMLIVRAIIRLKNLMNRLRTIFV
ncbi:hypothetical protein IKQ38_01930 [Candidatus Saccharibacteria bacterium]|nr:hypothetical protein [Candidatus Saccharibacteria bacterium]